MRANRFEKYLWVTGDYTMMLAARRLRRRETRRVREPDPPAPPESSPASDDRRSMWLRRVRECPELLLRWRLGLRMFGGEIVWFEGIREIKKKSRDWGDELPEGVDRTITLISFPTDHDIAGLSTGNVIADDEGMLLHETKFENPIAVNEGCSISYTLFLKNKET